MRKEYDLANLGAGRPNPYAKRLGAAGREAILERYYASEHLVRLDDEVASAFPSPEAVNEALRLVMRLREIGVGNAKRVAARRGVRGRRPT